MLWYLVLPLVILGFVAAVVTRLQGNGREDAGSVNAPASQCGTCDGNNSKCEQECMMEAAVKPVEYFDDEELDRYKGRPSDAYTDDEADEFAEVMYTMRPEEVRDWNRSLILRGVNVPDQIKDELIAMMDS